MSSTTKGGQGKTLTPDNNYTKNQAKAYKICAASFKGLTFKEAERVLFDLLGGIKTTAKIS